VGAPGTCGNGAGRAKTISRPDIVMIAAAEIFGSVEEDGDVEEEI